jgi:hypothetical protein
MVIPRHPSSFTSKTHPESQWLLSAGRGHRWYEIGTSFFGDPEPGVLLTQTAIFAPKGLLGFVYWYALYPADGTFAMHPIRPDKTARVT